ncbi:nudC domain-containing protein 3 isoform X2 [Odocoileus virginianus]|uniref:NudC domain-containing protein 3 isoform X2 n=1 Tax=Odocoileus virginianus TaxID=9874 RepID=A0A6J0XIV9_ODOVR
MSLGQLLRRVAVSPGTAMSHMSGRGSQAPLFLIFLSFGPWGMAQPALSSCGCGVLTLSNGGGLSSALPLSQMWESISPVVGNSDYLKFLLFAGHPDVRGSVSLWLCASALSSHVCVVSPGSRARPCHWSLRDRRRQEQFQRNPDSYNGAVRENYTWSQDYTDLELKVPVPRHVVKGKQVSVTLSSTSIRVAVLEENEERVLMEGKFTHKINTESSLWSLEPGKCVLVSLNKVGEYWWSAILEGEEQIDIDKINKERSMATVDEEEHAVLDRLTFDYHQKLQGKPQSHELKVHEMLKKGWDAEGSPFRGQRFDPAMFNISPGAVQF